VLQEAGASRAKLALDRQRAGKYATMWARQQAAAHDEARPAAAE